MKSKKIKLHWNNLDFLPDPDAIEQRPLAGVTRWVLYGLTAILVSFGIWATISEIDEIVTTRGKLITTTPNLVVQPMETSIIQSIDVRTGQIVKKGERLASLDPTFAGADESVLRGGMSSLDARARRLESELSNRTDSQSKSSSEQDEKLQAELREARLKNYQARIKVFDGNLGRLQASLKSNRQDQKMLDARVRSLAEIENMQEKLVSQNYGARKSLLEAREKKLEIDRDFEMARNREVEIQKEITIVEADRDAFRKDWRQKIMEELIDVKRERDSTADQLQKAEKRSSLVSLVSPADAVVLEVAQRSIGSIVREAETLFTLVPLNVPLEAEVQINASDVGFVKVGDAVRIKLDAFPFQKHGSMQGRMTVVSNDAFSRDANSQNENSTGRGGGAYYLGRVSLDTTRLDNVDKEFGLLPGYSLTGEVKVGRRSVISYFLYPIIRTLDESLKEHR